MGMTGCARVSTDIQDEASQLELLGAAGCDVFYVDHASGKDMDRPEWQNCLKSLHRGDTLVIVRLDRLGRSLVDLIETIETLGERGVHLRSLSEAIDTTTPVGALMLQIAGTFAQYERSLIQARTREGMAAARARGAHIGRPHALTTEQVTQAQRMRATVEPVALIARILGVSRTTIYRATA